MKALLRLEIIGDDTNRLMKFYKNIFNDCIPGLGDFVIGKTPPSCWVAKIIGFDDKYKYSRCFLKSKKDYTHANSKGSRGVYAEYILESGVIYEVYEKVSHKRAVRYFCTVSDAGDIIQLSEKEVIDWLSNTLGSTSSLPQDNA